MCVCEWSRIFELVVRLDPDAFFSKTILLYKTYGAKCTKDCHLCFDTSLSYNG